MSCWIEAATTSTRPSRRSPRCGPSSLSVVANVYGALGLAPQADTLFAQAIGLTRTLPGNADAELASALTGWAGNLIMQSKFDRAEPLLEEAIQRLRQRDPDNPSVAEPLRALGRAQTYTGDHAGPRR